MSDGFFGFVACIFVVAAIIYGIATLNAYQTCDGVVQDNSLGWPSCVAKGGSK